MPVERIAPASRAARIRSPADGSIIALDPDITRDQQGVPFVVEGAASGLRLRLDQAPLDGRVAMML